MTNSNPATLNEHQKFRADLPFYINGTLPQEDCAWMESYLQRYPAARNELGKEENLREALREATLLQAETITPEEKLARFLREMPVELAQSPSLWQRLFAKLTQTPIDKVPTVKELWQQGIHVPSPAFAVLLVLICSQALLMGRNALDEQTQYRSQPLSSCQKLPALRVIIKPESKYSDLVVLLRKTDTTVVAGPSDSGELWLAINGNREARLPSTLDQLRSNPLVSEAIPLPVGPCKS